MLNRTAAKQRLIKSKAWEMTRLTINSISLYGGLCHSNVVAVKSNSPNRSCDGQIIDFGNNEMSFITAASLVRMQAVRRS